MQPDTIFCFTISVIIKVSPSFVFIKKWQLSVQNKEISVQIKVKVENDSQMYSLKLHTLWSPMKKDGYIGIVGYFDAVN